MEMDTQETLLDSQTDPKIIEDTITSVHDSSFDSINSDHNYHLKSIEDDDDDEIIPSSIDPSTLDTLLVRQVEQPNIMDNHKLKPCSISIEPCDKIWATLKLIKDLQDDNDSEENNTSKNDDIDMSCNADSNSEQESTIHGDESNMTKQANPMVPYIQYEPVLGNGNTALPNFLFSVKSTRPLYHCYTCGRQYSHRKTLRDHSERVHNIIIPLMRTKPETNNTLTNKKIDIKTSESVTGINNEEESMIEQAEEQPEESEVIMDDSSDTTDTSSKSKNLHACTHCDRSYADAYNLKIHLEAIHDVMGLIKHRNGVPSKKIRQARQAMKMLRCKDCGKHFHQIAKLKEHTLKVHGYTTDNMEIHNQQILRSRLRQTTEIIREKPDRESNDTTNEKKRKTLKCPVCEKLYIDRISWKLHCKKIHGVMIPNGRYDKQSFDEYIRTSMKKKIRPMASGRGKGRSGYECAQCDQRFKKEVYFDSHMLKHKNDYDSSRSNENLVLPSGDWIKCDLCRKTIRWKKNMRSHRERCEILYGMKRPHGCNLCQKRFILACNLKRHLKVVHDISNPDETTDEPEQSTSTRNLRTKGRVNYDEKINQNNTNSNKLIDFNIPLIIRQTEFKKIPPIEYPKIEPVKPIQQQMESTQSTQSPGTIQCILCNRHCKKIHRHFVDYHKIPHPEALVSQCKPSPIVDIEPQVNENIKEANQIHKVVLPVKRRRRNTRKSVYSARSRYSRHGYFIVPGPNKNFELITNENNQKMYRCKICLHTALNYHTSRSHQRVSHADQFDVIPRMKTKRIINQRINQQWKNPQRKKRTHPSLEELRRRSSSQSSRTTRASQRIKEEINFECLNCHRSFRNAEVHASHKVSCNQRMSFDPARIETIKTEPADTRESSDRDSGIGISITIKKKNNSYEVVSRDSSNQGDFSKDDTVSSDASSDLGMMNNKNSNQPHFSAQYSRDHRVLKIQKSEEDDVEIDLVSDDPVPINCPENNEKTSLLQVRSLIDLCKKVIEKASKKKIGRFQCPECFANWSCARALSVHRRIHSRGNKISL